MMFPSASFQFQSTLPRGERQIIMQRNMVSSDFNPRSREGSDARTAISDRFGLIISIHAPARGATLIMRAMTQVQPISIHAPARGATRPRYNYVRCNSVFQSTLPRGERHWAGNQVMSIVNISIHAPARGATSKRISHNPNRAISIHAPARGATAIITKYQSKLL